jgi:hypothetical protein
MLKAHRTQGNAQGEGDSVSFDPKYYFGNNVHQPDDQAACTDVIVRTHWQGQLALARAGI